MSPTRRTWDDARRILCVRLDQMGDVLMTEPALRALRAPRPGRRITLLTSPSGGAVARLLASVDEVIEYDAPWMKATATRADSSPDFSMIDRLREHCFDAAAIFTVYSQNPLPSAMLCYLADIPLRLAHCRENPYQLLTDWIKDPEPEPVVRHEVRRQLDLVAAVGARVEDDRMRLIVPEASRRAALERLRAAGIDPSRPWVVVHPGSTAPSRRWMPERFAEVARRLVEEDGVQAVFTGDRGERDLIAGIREAMGAPSASLAGALDLAGLAAVLEASPLLLSNNTGPVHVAAAVGTPVVDLYALTNPQHTPWGVPSRVLNADVPCKWCYKSICPEGHHDCLRGVGAGEVVAAVRSLLAETRDRAVASPAAIA